MFDLVLISSFVVTVMAKLPHPSSYSGPIERLVAEVEDVEYQATTMRVLVNYYPHLSESGVGPIYDTASSVPQNKQANLPTHHLTTQTTHNLKDREDDMKDEEDIKDREEEIKDIEEDGKKAAEAVKDNLINLGEDVLRRADDTKQELETIESQVQSNSPQGKSADTEQVLTGVGEKIRYSTESAGADSEGKRHVISVDVDEVIGESGPIYTLMKYEDKVVPEISATESVVIPAKPSLSTKLSGDIVKRLKALSNQGNTLDQTGKTVRSSMHNDDILELTKDIVKDAVEMTENLPQASAAKVTETTVNLPQGSISNPSLSVASTPKVSLSETNVPKLDKSQHGIPSLNQSQPSIPDSSQLESSRTQSIIPEFSESEPQTLTGKITSRVRDLINENLRLIRRETGEKVPNLSEADQAIINSKIPNQIDEIADVVDPTALKSSLDLIKSTGSQEKNNKLPISHQQSRSTGLQPTSASESALIDGVLGAITDGKVQQSLQDRLGSQSSPATFGLDFNGKHREEDRKKEKLKLVRHVIANIDDLFEVVYEGEEGRRKGTDSGLHITGQLQFDDI